MISTSAHPSSCSPIKAQTEDIDLIEKTSKIQKLERELAQNEEMQACYKKQIEHLKKTLEALTPASSELESIKKEIRHRESCLYWSLQVSASIREDLQNPAPSPLFYKRWSAGLG